MKTISLSTLLAALCALASGCALGPGSSTVVNPFDWHDAGSPVSVALPPPAQAPGVQVAGR